MARVSLAQVDSDGDRGSVSIPVAAPLTDGTDYSTWRASARGLLTATEAITRSVTTKRTLESELEEVAAAIPTNPDVQLNDVWVLEFKIVGMNGPIYTLTIPGADRSAGVIRNGRVELEIVGAGIGATFRAAFEDNYLYPGTLDNPAAPAVNGQNPGEAILQTVYVKRT